MRIKDISPHFVIRKEPAEKFAPLLYVFVIFLLTIFINQNSVLVEDDTCFVFWGKGIKPQLALFYGSWCVILENILMYCCPLFFKINLQNWALTAGVVFKSLIITLMAIYFYKFMKFKKLSLSYSLILSFLGYCIFFILSFKTLYNDLIIYLGFFRFVIPACIQIIFLYYLYKIYKGKQINRYFIAVLALLTASSSEVTGIISIISVILLILYDKLILKKTNKDYLIIFSALVVGLILLVTSKGFLWHYNSKVHNLLSPLEIAAYLSEFFSLYIKKIIYDYIFVYISFIVLVLLNFCNRKKNLSDIVFASVLIISIMIFASLFIFAGKTSHENNFWVVHRDIYSIYIPVYILAVLILFSNYISDNRKTANVVLTALIFLLTVNFFFNILYLSNTLKNIKDFSYLRDKMYLYSNYKGIPAILPNFGKFMAAKSMFANYHIQIEDFNDFVSEKYFEIDVMQIMKEKYYPITYHCRNTEQTISIEKNIGEALQRYKEYGGHYDEIKRNDYNFADLEDRNFVLQ